MYVDEECALIDLWVPNNFKDLPLELPKAYVESAIRIGTSQSACRKVAEAWLQWVLR